MNDIFSAFGAEQALGLGIGEHAAFFEGFQQVFAAMFDDEKDNPWSEAFFSS